MKRRVFKFAIGLTQDVSALAGMNPQQRNIEIAFECVNTFIDIFKYFETRWETQQLSDLKQQEIEQLAVQKQQEAEEQHQELELKCREMWKVFYQQSDCNQVVWKESSISYQSLKDVADMLIEAVNQGRELKDNILTEEMCRQNAEQIYELDETVRKSMYRYNCILENMQTGGNNNEN